MPKASPDDPAPQGGTAERLIRDHGLWTRDTTTGRRLVWGDLTEDERRDLRDADLRGAELRDADLRGAILCGANLDGADLRGTGVAAFQVSHRAILVPSSDPQDPVLTYGCETHALSLWREHVRELCERHEPDDADRYEREIRALIALCETIPPPTVSQGER